MPHRLNIKPQAIEYILNHDLHRNPVTVVVMLMSFKRDARLIDIQGADLMDLHMQTKMPDRVFIGYQEMFPTIEAEFQEYVTSAEHGRDCSRGVHAPPLYLLLALDF